VAFDRIGAGKAIVLTLKKLFLAEYQIEFYALSGVIVGGLVAGKLVVVLDHTSLGHRFAADHRPGLAALYKTITYTAVAFVVVTSEKLLHAYREHDGVASAITAIREKRDGSLILAKVLCVGLAFLGYHLFAAADGRPGKGTSGARSGRDGSPGSAQGAAGPRRPRLTVQIVTGWSRPATRTSPWRVKGSSSPSADMPSARTCVTSSSVITIWASISRVSRSSRLVTLTVSPITR